MQCLTLFFRGKFRFAISSLCPTLHCQKEISHLTERRTHDHLHVNQVLPRLPDLKMMNYSVWDSLTKKFIKQELKDKIKQRGMKY